MRPDEVRNVKGSIDVMDWGSRMIVEEAACGRKGEAEDAGKSRERGGMTQRTNGRRGMRGM